MLNQTLSSLDNHFRYALMAVGLLVKGGINHFYIRAYDCFLDIGYFLRTLVDEQDHQVHIRVIGGNGSGYLL